MGLLDLLPKTRFAFAGQKPPLAGLDEKDSTVHLEYSLNGKPIQGKNLPAPSELDLNGQTPEKYSDNLPK
jgi:hypothetical protein